MSIYVEVRVCDEDRDRTVRLKAAFDQLEVFESRITGELRLIPDPERKSAAWGGDLSDIPQVPLWHQTLEGTGWDAKPDDQ